MSPGCWVLCQQCALCNHSSLALPGQLRPKPSFRIWAFRISANWHYCSVLSQVNQCKEFHQKDERTHWASSWWNAYRSSHLWSQCQCLLSSLSSILHWRQSLAECQESEYRSACDQARWLSCQFFLS